MRIILVLLSFAIVQPLQAQCPCGCETTGVCTCQDCPNHVHLKQTYQEAAQQAVKDRKPMLVFVGCPSRDVPGSVCWPCSVVEWERLAWTSVKGIVVSVPDGGWLACGNSPLPADASAIAIHAEIAKLQMPTQSSAQRSNGNARRAVQPMAVPFVPSGRQDLADADLVPAVWPEELVFLKDMERYQTAKFSQASFNRSGHGINTVIPRSDLGEKWMVPGGLEGVKGWRNILFRKPTNRVRNWFGHVDPNDSPQLGVWGSEITHQRSYADGAEFADILVNAETKEIFEGRRAIKKDGQWFRTVEYRNAAAQPVGYKRVPVAKCVDCHNITNGPGTGGYGTGLIPGGDTVVSEPFPALER